MLIVEVDSFELCSAVDICVEKSDFLNFLTWINSLIITSYYRLRRHLIFSAKVIGKHKVKGTVNIT